MIEWVQKFLGAPADLTAGTTRLEAELKKLDAQIAETSERREHCSKEMRPAIIRGDGDRFLAAHMGAGLDRELEALRTTRADLVAALAENRVLVEAAKLEKRWKAARAMVPGLISDAREIAEAISHLWECVRKLLTSITVFEHALPAHAPDFEVGSMAKRLSGLCMRHAFVVSNGAIVGGSFHSHPAELAKTGTADVVAGIERYTDFALKAVPAETHPPAEPTKEVTTNAQSD